MLAIFGGQWVSQTPLWRRFHAERAGAGYRDHCLRIRGLGAAGVAAAGSARLPEHLREAGNDGFLALGIIVLRPTLHMPPLTRFIDGSGPVFAGKVFPLRSSPSLAAPSADSIP